MTLLQPDSPDLPARLQRPDALLVACLCAAWCGTCRTYQQAMTELAARHPQATFVWIDIEDHAELCDDVDVDDFPTLLLQDARGTRFFGTLLPHISHLDALLERLAPDAPSQPGAPALFVRLAGGA